MLTRTRHQPARAAWKLQCIVAFCAPSKSERECFALLAPLSVKDAEADPFRLLFLFFLLLSCYARGPEVHVHVATPTSSGLSPTLARYLTDARRDYPAPILPRSHSGCCCPFGEVSTKQKHDHDLQVLFAPGPHVHRDCNGVTCNNGKVFGE
jgi:hypothetical protein